MTFILVVDDENVTRRVVAHTLKTMNIETLEASNATEAYQIAQENPISLALVDINLPDVDGFTLMSHLRELPHMHHIPMIAFTARHDPQDELLAKENGAVDILRKPFSTQELRQMISQYLSLE